MLVSSPDQEGVHVKFRTRGQYPVAGLIPTDRSREIAETSFHWNYTTFLNIVFLALGGYLYWLYRNRARLGGGNGLAIDPVCGMQVQTANAPANRVHDGHDHWFCSDRCATHFDGDPDGFCPVAATEAGREYI